MRQPGGKNLDVYKVVEDSGPVPDPPGPDDRVFEYVFKEDRDDYRPGLRFVVTRPAIMTYQDWVIYIENGDDRTKLEGVRGSRMRDGGTTNMRTALGLLHSPTQLSRENALPSWTPEGGQRVFLTREERPGGFTEL